MSYDWGRTMNENTDKPYAWQAVGGTIWNHKTSEDDTPLYIKPQWQGLTLEDIDDIGVSKDWVYGARWAEAKLKEKNGG
jgi:hypothetical protein